MLRTPLFVVITLALSLMGATQAWAAIIYDTHNLNTVGELVPNGDDGTPNRPPGRLMGNTLVFTAGTARALDSVTLEYGTYHIAGNTATQTITLSLYNTDGPPDLTGPGANGNQPGTLIASRSITTSQFNSGIVTATLSFDFTGVTVPNSVVAIVGSTFTTNANTLTGYIASSDFTPVVGSNPHGDRLWFGSTFGSAGDFRSDAAWARADSDDDPSVSNNMALVVNAHNVPEPSAGMLTCAAAFGWLAWRRGPSPGVPR